MKIAPLIGGWRSVSLNLNDLCPQKPVRWTANTSNSRFKREKKRKNKNVRSKTQTMALSSWLYFRVLQNWLPLRSYCADEVVVVFRLTHTTQEIQGEVVLNGVNECYVGDFPFIKCGCQRQQLSRTYTVEATVRLITETHLISLSKAVYGFLPRQVHHRTAIRVRRRLKHLIR